jgi:hypothetical protein
MRIENTKYGFIVIIENGIIEKIVCKYDGICTVYFYEKPPKKLGIGCDVYNRQYGIPVSEDGSKLFIGSWAKGEGGNKKGLSAYDIETGSLLWNSPEGRIRSIFVYSTYLIAVKSYSAVFKYDINNGSKTGEIKSGTVDHAFDLGFPYIYVDSFKGKQSIIDVEKMSVVKKYSKKIVNPFNCLSVLIQNAVLDDNVLTISGIEEYPNMDHSKSGGIAFSRVIDTDFNAVDSGLCYYERIKK